MKLLLVCLCFSVFFVSCKNINEKVIDLDLTCITPVPDYTAQQWYTMPNETGSTLGLNRGSAPQPTDFEVNIALVSDGLDTRHCEFKDKFDLASSWNFYTNATTPLVSADYMKRGTMMAGLLAAKDDQVGIKGITTSSKIVFMGLQNNRTEINEEDAMRRNSNSYEVSVNNWATSPDDKGLIADHDKWERALDSNINTKTKITYVFGAGESGRANVDTRDIRQRDSNLNNYVNYHRVMAVCSFDSSGKALSYGITGSNLIVCGPSIGSKVVVSTDVLGDGGYNGTKVNNDFTDNDQLFYAGDVSTALVGGAVAHILGVKSTMPTGNTARHSWRDVRLILAETATKIDAADSSWIDGSTLISDPSKRYHHSEKYGFGAVNLEKAVNLAKTWETLEVNPYMDVSFEATAGTGNISTITISEADIVTKVTAIEYVEVMVYSDLAGDLNNSGISLISPSLTGDATADGITSNLLPKDVSIGLLKNDPAFKFPSAWRFGSVRDIGRNPEGTWKLKVDPAVIGANPKISRWSIKFYGRVGS